MPSGGSAENSVSHFQKSKSASPPGGVGNPEALAQMLHEQHPEASAAQLEGIIAACDISTQEPRVAAERLGLRILV